MESFHACEENRLPSLSTVFRMRALLSIRKRMVSKLCCSFAALAVFTLASCSTTPVPESDVNLPGAWQSASSSAVVANDWWKSFGDTNLVNLIEEALVENSSLVAMRARVDAAMEQTRIVGSAALPSVNGQVGSSRQQQVFVGLPIPGAAGPLKSRATSHSFQLVADWELDVWGRVRSGRNAALSDYLAATDDLRGARLSLVGQIVRGWFRLAEAEKQLELSRATALSFEETEAKISDRYTNGLRSSQEVRLSKSNAASARAVTALRETELNDARRQLLALLGRYPDGDLSGSDVFRVPLNEIPAGVPSGLLERRPDLLAARWKLKAAGYRVDEAKAARLPAIGLTVSGGRTSSELKDLMDHDFSIWSLAANAAQPIFQGGRLRSNVRMNKALMQAAAADYDAAVLNAFREVETALVNESLLADRESELVEAGRLANAARTLAQDRYESGLGNLLSVLEAQRRALESESQMVFVRRVRLDNRVALHLALGGGIEWDNDDENGS